MRELIVHCGMPKTGLTAIQRFLFENRQALLSQGILYPVSGCYHKANVNHHALFYALCPDRKKINTPLREPDYIFDDYCEHLEQEVSKSRAQKVILSSEMVFNPVFDADCLTYFKNKLNFNNISILIILRHQDDHIESGYAQRVTGPQRFSGTPSQHLEIMRDLNIYNYYDRLMTFEGVFGKHYLHIFWYHKIKSDAVKVISRLCQIDETHCVKNSNRINARRSWLYVRILQYTNKYAPAEGVNRSMGHKLAHFIDSAVVAFGLRGLTDRLCRPFAEWQKNYIRSEFSSINQLVNDRYIRRQKLDERE